MQSCNYDKTKLLHQLGDMVRFIDEHAIQDSQETDHPLCGAVYQELRADLHKHMQKLNLAVSGLSNEGKYL